MSLFGWLTGSDAAATSNAAAQDQYAKQQNAVGSQRSYAGTLPGAYNSIAQLYAPYASVGSSTLPMLMNGLGLNGPEGSAAFTSAYRATPGYQYGLDEGIKSVNSTANARHQLQSGANEKAILNYGQNYEDQKSGDYLARLMGLQGQGLQATGAQASTMGQGLNAQQNAMNLAYQGDYGSAPTIGQGMVAGANAESQALTNLLGMGTYLGGAWLGGGAKMPSRPSFGVGVNYNNIGR